MKLDKIWHLELFWRDLHVIWHLVILKADQLKKPPCTLELKMFQYLASGEWAAEGVDNSHQGAPGWAGERLERQVQGEKSPHHGSRLREILALKSSISVSPPTFRMAHLWS